MNGNQGWVFPICASLVLVLNAGCSLEAPSKNARFLIELGDSFDRTVDWDLPILDAFTFPMPKASPPASLNGFACLALNVTGPGIPNTSATTFGTLNQRFNSTFNDQSFCSYRGIMKGPIFPQGGIYSSQVIEATIPTGSPRLIQVVGVNDSTACAPGALGAGNFSSYGDGRFYEVGRAKIATVFSDLAVTVNNQWPVAVGSQFQRKMDCPDCGVLHLNSLPLDGLETVDSSNVKMAQAFTVASAGRRLSSVQFTLSAAAASTANVSIMRDSSGNPSAATPDIIDTAAGVVIPVGTNVIVNAFMSAGAPLDPGVYWIVITRLGAAFDLKGNVGSLSGPYNALRYGTSGPWANATNLNSIAYKVVTCQ